VCALKEYLQVETDKNIVKDKELSELKSIKEVSENKNCSDNQLEVSLRDATDRIDSQNNEINRLNERLQEVNSEIEVLNEELCQAKTENTGMKRQLELKQVEVEEYLEEIRNLENDKVSCKRKEIVVLNQHQSEIQSLNDDIDTNRFNFMKKISKLEEHLSCEYEERMKILREKFHLEKETIKNQNCIEKDEIISRLRSDLRKKNILLKDSQSLVDKLQQENSKRLLVKQLKNQVEDLEHENMSAIRAKKNAEIELQEVKQQMEELNNAKIKLEDKYFASARENAALSTQILENEDELEEILKRYKSSVAEISTDQITLQDQAMQIIELENENEKLKEQVSDMSVKLVVLEEDVDKKSKQKGLEIKVVDLEQRIELEQTSRKRMETQIERLRQSIKKMDKESDEMRYKAQGEQEKNRKLLNQLRDLKEDYMSLQGKEADITERNIHLGKRLEIAEAENIVMKKELELALQRIDEFHQAISSCSEVDSDTDTMTYSDALDEDVEMFLVNHRRAMSVQRERESIIRDSIARELDDAASDLR